MGKVLRWAILGAGTAGRARAGAIAEDPRCELVAVYRGRYAADLGARVYDDIDEAIAAADAVAVSSPNAMHPAHIRRALEANKHVVVEYPVAPTPEQAAELFTLARQRRRMLHVEHIELLGAVAEALRAHVEPETVTSVNVGFDRPGPADLPGERLAMHNVARLHRVVDVAGPIARVDAIRHEPGGLYADMTLASGAPLRAVFLQGPGLRRSTRLDVRAGTRLWCQVDRDLQRDGQSMTLMTPMGLFAADHDNVMGRLMGVARPYVSRRRILHVLDVVKALQQREVPQVVAPR